MAKARDCPTHKIAFMENPVTMATGVRPWSGKCCTVCVIYSTHIYTKVPCISLKILLLYYCFYQSSLSLFPWGILYNWISMCLQIHPTLNFSYRSTRRFQHLCRMCKCRSVEKITNLICRHIYDQTILFSAWEVRAASTFLVVFF